MTIAEMKARRQEIASRLDEIKADTLEERSKTELDGIAQEVETLNAEYKDLIAQETRAMATVEEFKPVVETTAQIDENMARRKAFQNYVATGKADPCLRATVTGNVTSVIIPQEITSQLLKIDSHYGTLYAAVTKTTYAAGVNYPTTDFAPTVEWVEERSVATDSKVTTSYVSFTGHKAQVKVSISLEVSVMALPEFETMIVNKIQEAFAKSFDSVILAGDGKTQPEGITVTTGGQTFTMTDPTAFDQWVNSLALVPMSEQADVALIVNNEDFIATLMALKNTNGTPIAQAAYVNGLQTPTFMGKPVILVQNQGLPTLTTGGVIACWVDLKDYVLNMNKQLTMKVYTDEATDDLVYKATALVDGKLVNTDSLVKISYSATANASLKKAA